MDRADHDVITIAGADIKEMKDKKCMFFYQNYSVAYKLTMPYPEQTRKSTRTGSWKAGA